MLLFKQIHTSNESPSSLKKDTFGRIILPQPAHRGIYSATQKKNKEKQNKTKVNIKDHAKKEKKK